MSTSPDADVVATSGADAAPARTVATASDPLGGAALGIMACILGVICCLLILVLARLFSAPRSGRALALLPRSGAPISVSVRHIVPTLSLTQLSLSRT